MHSIIKYLLSALQEKLLPVLNFIWVGFIIFGQFIQLFLPKYKI
jgi:hypothetical protein